MKLLPIGTVARWFN
ncbi:Protein of unknown function [Bacillus toyonensis]|nr:Protein of unknown function [Bacillus toyonensis]